MSAVKRFSSNHVFQNSWVVKDLRTAVESWTETLGVGPFFVGAFGADELIDIEYHDGPGELALKIALAQAGPMQVELIEPLGSAPSAYRDTVPPGLSAFHHVAIWSEDFEATLEAFRRGGHAVANRGRIRDSARFAYIDTSESLNCMVEVVERHPKIIELFERISAASVDWDGSEPVRLL